MSTEQAAVGSEETFCVGVPAWITVDPATGRIEISVDLGEAVDGVRENDGPSAAALAVLARLPESFGATLRVAP